jgi:hypothetical protein
MGGYHPTRRMGGTIKEWSREKIPLQASAFCFVD